MTIQEAEKEIPDLDTYCKMACENCLHDYYCPTDCKENEKARRIGITKIQKAYARHEGDMFEVMKYVRRA